MRLKSFSLLKGALNRQRSYRRFEKLNGYFLLLGLE